MHHVRRADLADVVPLDLGSSPWRNVDQDRVDRFADATDDHQWIHVDRERAMAGPFGTTIAHGYLLMSLVPAMLSEMLEITDEQMNINYGMNRVRFTAPVPVGASVRLTSRVTEATRRPTGLLYTVHAELHVRDAQRPALVGDFVYLSTPLVAEESHDDQH